MFLDNINDNLLSESLFFKPKKDPNKKYLTDSEINSIINELKKVSSNFIDNKDKHLTIFKQGKYKVNKPINDIAYGYFPKKYSSELRSYLASLKSDNKYIKSFVARNIDSFNGVVVLAKLNDKYYYWKNN